MTKSEGIYHLPIVGIGASAGGLEAFEQFFTNMPSDVGMAFALIQHLDPDHKSILSELIRRYTQMKVFEVKDGMNVEPNCIYIIPPNRYMAILHGTLQLIEPTEPYRHKEPIDFFLRSLAQDQGVHSIGIILSGTGTGGTLGLKAIKEVGGLTMVQDPESAKYDGMPKSAIATGLVDYVLPPNKMPEQLIAYIQHDFVRVPNKITATVSEKSDWLQKVFILLRSHTGHDFSYYKKNSIIRRIERRMMINQMDSAADYVKYLQENPMETDTLFRELLIGVTNFFRDPEAFDILKEKMMPSFFENRTPDRPIRIWVPACSTGEEAYSIAMLISECLNELAQKFQVQIFATDIDSYAIETARQGIYPDSIAVDVPPKRLQHFFHKDGNFLRVNKAIRDMMVFATQNVISDPPFSKTDLISCRNLLIYMGEELQKKLMPLFHYSLNRNGYLFLGNSETIGNFDDLFAVINRRWKIFQRKGDIPIQRQPVIHFLATDGNEMQTKWNNKTMENASIQVITERLLLDNYSPACVIINEKNDVVYFHGRTGKYLEPASGEARLNILEMAREGLKSILTTSLRKAVSENSDVLHEDLQVKTNGDVQVIDLEVRIISKGVSSEKLIMVVFRDKVIKPSAKSKPSAESEKISSKSGGKSGIRIKELEQELKSTKEYLQATIEELETANEELKSTNEELQSSNEELQSTNEELETSKEELQSVNEELVTVNNELEKKIEQLSKVNNDMNNLLASTKIGTIFLDDDLRIKRFTPAATQFVNLIQSDIGRPFSHIVSNLAYDHLNQDANDVLETLVSKQFEVQTTNGLWYSVRIMPYRTIENVIEGIVMTFGDITQQKQTEMEVQESREYAENILETISESLLVLDNELRIVSANRSFYQTFKTTSEDTVNKFLYDLGNSQWRVPELQNLLAKILSEDTSFNDFKIEYEFPIIGNRVMLLNGRRVHREMSDSRLILLAIEDITKQKDK